MWDNASPANHLGSAILPGSPTQTTAWTLWQVDLATLPDVAGNLTNVQQIYIQIYSGGSGDKGAGTMHLDQLELVKAVVVQQPPVITGAGGTLGYTEGDGAVAIDILLTVSDPDDTNLQSATVEITGNYQNGEDVLDCATPGGLSESWSPSTGILTLAGDAPLATYETALESVTYQNTATHPRSYDRSVRWRVDDGTNNSAPVSSTITVTPTPPAMIDNFESYANTDQVFRRLTMIDNTKQQVYVVDDDANVLKAIFEVPNNLDAEVTLFMHPAECLERLRVQKCDLLIVGKIGEMDGIELLARAKQLAPWVPVLFMTGNYDIPTAVEAVKAGAEDIIQKPGDKKLFARKVEFILQERVSIATRFWRGSDSDRNENTGGDH